MAGVGFEAVAWFNGGLFDDADALPLERSDIETVLAASEAAAGRSSGRESGEPIESGEPMDSRRMCFEQGLACVYQPHGEPEVIVAEWPNGVVERHDLKAGTRTQRCCSRSTGGRCTAWATFTGTTGREWPMRWSRPGPSG